MNEEIVLLQDGIRAEEIALGHGHMELADLLSTLNSVSGPTYDTFVYIMA